MKKKFIWASAHQPTKEQLNYLNLKGDIIYLKDIAPNIFNELTNLKLDSDLEGLASSLVTIAKKHTLVQPAGSPAFQAVLGMYRASHIYGDFGLWYAYSERVSQDMPQPDGSVKKISIFQHKGWVEV